MTIRELFNELRMIPDWDKEVVIMGMGGIFRTRSVIPNLIDENSILITMDGKDEARNDD